jgi:hypothetical protein
MATDPELLRTLEVAEKALQQVGQVLEIVTMSLRSRTQMGGGDYIERPVATHNDDFTVVKWFNQNLFHFSKLRAACIKVLWETWKQGLSEVRQADILSKAQSDQKRLDHVFREPNGSYHPAWGLMIVKRSSGSYALYVPEGFEID